MSIQERKCMYFVMSPRIQTAVTYLEWKRDCQGLQCRDLYCRSRSSISNTQSHSSFLIAKVYHGDNQGSHVQLSLRPSSQRSARPSVSLMCSLPPNGSRASSGFVSFSFGPGLSSPAEVKTNMNLGKFAQVFQRTSHICLRKLARSSEGFLVPTKTMLDNHIG